jgi:hypothetical protein
MRCGGCEADFPVKRANQKFCTTKCGNRARQRAHVARLKEAAQRKRRAPAQRLAAANRPLFFFLNI